MDGGTIIYTKLIAVICYSKNKSSILDLWIFEESSTIQNIVSRIKSLRGEFHIIGHVKLTEEGYAH